ncbi:adenine phosphoribosyltransferase [Parasponia andersonii]|uniref:Adenine phosphoribosyltransferase n=1 Tax=Parasponia andersonii TaxID=3476 RepID=A0A2P5C0R2_PARAD|nr:adenine phosphoribosyltransferase [Parasponia andersonii]
MANQALGFLVILLLLLDGAPTPSESLSYSQYRTLFSLSHSLLTRVANLRAARGDLSGANRARVMASKLERGMGLGLWRSMWSAGWDYVSNYAWRRDLPYSELYGVVSDSNKLLRWLGELTRAESDAERAEWLARNYKNVLSVSRSLLRRLLGVFSQSGTLREVVEAVQREVVDGGLLRDCLELGSNDLKGLIQILKDLGLQFVSTQDYSNDDL